MKHELTLVLFGGVLGAYFCALACDIRLKRRLDRHDQGKQPVILKAGDNEYTVKVLEVEEFGFVQSDGG